MVTFEEKISTYERESEEVRHKIIRGSDEHLDVLIAARNLIESTNKKLAGLINDICSDLNKFSEEELNKALPSLFDLYSTVIRLVATLKRSSFAVDLKSTCVEYYMNVDNLREVIHDIEKFRLSEDSEFDQIMKNINES